jgi:hypothetical protein
LILFPLLVSLAYIGYEHRDKIADQYNAAYPADPAKRAAIERCIAENPNFIRLDADDRQRCYRRTWGASPFAVAPSGPLSSAYSPSHLAGNDIRRQEAGASYAAAVMQAPSPVPVRTGTDVTAPLPAAAHRDPPRHPAVRHFGFARDAR